MVTVGKLMKTNLLAVGKDTSVEEAARLMQACSVGSLLITSEDRPIGIVTESDIVRKVVAAQQAPHLVLVESIMSSPIVGIKEDCQLTHAAALMNENHTRHLGVTHGNQLVGMLSVRDLLHPVAIDDF